MCVHLYMYVCVCVCMQIVCVCVCVYANCVCMCVCMHTQCVCVCMCACMWCECVCVCKHNGAIVAGGGLPLISPSLLQSPRPSSSTMATADGIPPSPPGSPSHRNTPTTTSSGSADTPMHTRTSKRPAMSGTAVSTSLPVATTGTFSSGRKRRGGLCEFFMVTIPL